MNRRPRILLVAADAMLRQTIAEHLADQPGFRVGEAGSAPDGLGLAADHDLAVIDDSAAIDGGDPCRAFRDRRPSLPLLLLAAGVNGGGDTAADAVLAKPVRLAALTARIAELLARRVEPAAIAIGPWRFIAGRRCLRAPDGGTVRLTDKETAILLRLADAGGRAVSRQTLLDQVWGYSAAISTHTLETHIYRLRRKIESGGDGGRLLTEDGGYRLRLDS